jgi:antitoxin component of MazEF toxin-antitoxin module
MKLRIRRVGNSLGVILPKSVLAEWGVVEGDTLELTKHGIAPGGTKMRSQAMLDELKRSLSLAVVRRFGPQEIRAQSLANLHRWKAKGTWGSAYDEWTEILQRGNDGELFNTMLGRDDNSNRLRQSPPYVGLLTQKEVEEIYEEAPG